MKKSVGVGNHKFVVPDAETRKQALGPFVPKQSHSKFILEEAAKVFSPVDKPGQDDWLFTQKQPGQTYRSYETSQHHKLSAKRNKIYIVPLQTNMSKVFLEKLRVYCSAFFLGAKAIMYEEIDLKKYEIFINEKRNQFLIKNLTGLLKEILPGDAYCMIGVLMSDLYHRQDWNYLLGLGTKDRVGVFSFARYDPRFYGKQKYEHDFDLILEDSIGVMVHEITHMFGIRHCTFYNCLMNGKMSVEQGNRKPLELCPICLRKLQSNIGFNLQERYEKIFEVLQEFCGGTRGKITQPMVRSMIERIVKKKQVPK